MNKPAEVAVTQADTLAVQQFYASSAANLTGQELLELEQAFARHRTTNHQALVDALREAIGAIEDGTGLDEAICCSGHDCGCRGSSRRQLLLHNLRAALSEVSHG